MVKIVFCFLVLSLCIYCCLRRDFYVSVVMPEPLAAAMIDVVEEVHEIRLPGFFWRLARPTNPGIVANEKGFLMAFRANADSFSTFVRQKVFGKKKRHLCFVQLDHDFRPISQVSSASGMKCAEDPRLFRLHGSIYAIYNDGTCYPGTNDWAILLHMAKIEEENGKFVMKNAVPLHFPEAKNHNDHWAHERNWSPFIYQDELYLIYLVTPHIILKPDLETGICREVSLSSETPFLQWGEARGGTPAIEYGDSYLTFFHTAVQGEKWLAFHRSKDSSQKRVYCFGAYRFRKGPPFDILDATIVPLTGKNFYRSLRKIIFPTGLVETPQGLFLFFGKDNKKIFVAKVSKPRLEALLKPNACIE